MKNSACAKAQLRSDVIWSLNWSIGALMVSAAACLGFGNGYALFGGAMYSLGLFAGSVGRAWIYYRASTSA